MRQSAIPLAQRDGKRTAVKSDSNDLQHRRRPLTDAGAFKVRAKGSALEPAEGTLPAARIVYRRRAAESGRERFAPILCVSPAFAIRRYRGFSRCLVSREPGFTSRRRRDATRSRSLGTRDAIELVFLFATRATDRACTFRAVRAVPAAPDRPGKKRSRDSSQQELRHWKPASRLRFLAAADLGSRAR